MDEDRQPFLLSILSDSDSFDLRERRPVELLVRTFTDKCLEGFRAALTGTAGEEEVVGEIGDLADALNDVFLGFSGIEQVLITPWNAPDRLGLYLVDQLDLDAPPDEAVRSMLLRIGTRVMKTLQDKDESDWSERIDAMVHEAVALMVEPAAAGPAVPPTLN